MKLKELREKNKLSQAAFASTVGVSGKSIYLIEAGRLKLSKKLSDRIAEVYGEVVEPVEKLAKDARKKADKAATAAAEAVLDTEKKLDKRKRRTRAKVQADKTSAEMATEAVAAVVEKEVGKARRGRRKLEAAVEKAAVRVMPKIVIQSPLGGEITPDEILAKVGGAERIYVRVDQNKAYWVKGEESGEVDLW